MNNISLIVGASGQVGEHLANTLTELNREYIATHYNSSTINSVFLDIRNREDVFQQIASIKPNVIYLPAALTNVDYCEQNPGETHKVNVYGVANIVEATNRYKAKLIFFSTDYIFDGRNGPYTEEDLPNPLCEYGRQKLIAEHLIATRLVNYIIIRTTIVYGWERQGKNFVTRLVRTLQSNQEIKVPSDQIGTPTYAPYLAKISVQLAESEAKGVYNITGEDLISRYDFACNVARIFNYDQGLIIPTRTDDLPQIATRPLNAGLINRKILRVFSESPLPLRDCLGAMVKTNQQ